MGKLVSKDSIPGKFSPKNPKECIICGKMFIGASSNAKTCSPECSIALSQQRQRERFHKKYKRKGYNQKGENNNIFKKNPNKETRKNWVYSKYRKDYCEYCGNRKLDTKLTFVVHHKDGDPINNHPSNLVILCHRCHKLVHNKTISLGKV